MHTTLQVMNGLTFNKLKLARLCSVVGRKTSIASLLTIILIMSTILIIRFELSEGAPLVRDYLTSHDNDLVLSGGTWTLERISAEHPDALVAVTQDFSPKKSYILTRPLVVATDAMLDVTDRLLLLNSSAGDDIFPARILVFGRMEVSDSSLDSKDANPFHPRPFIAAIDGGKLDIRRSEIKHMGFALGSISSVAAVNYYNTSAFEIRNSIFAHNYNAFYSDSSFDFLILNNMFYRNIGYGVNAHSGSHDFLIKSNTLIGNGKQGIICSYKCENVTITENKVKNNVEGIGLHWLTNSSTIKDNVVINNEQFGIFIKTDSHSNSIGNNFLFNNGCHIGLFENSTDNSIYNNVIVDALDQYRYCENEPIYAHPDSRDNLVWQNEWLTGPALTTLKYSADTIHFDRYVSNKVGIDHPTAWILTGNSPDNVTFLPPKAQNHPSLGNFSITIQKVPQNTTFDMFVYQTVEENLSTWPEVIRTKYITLGDRSGQQVTYESDSRTLTEAYLISDGKAYTIRYETYTKIFGKNSLILDRMIASFTLSS